MSSANHNRIILNLTGELSEALQLYFNNKKITLVTRETCESFDEVNFIIVNSVTQAEEVESEFSTADKQIPILCLGHVQDVKSFLIANGRLIINPELTSSEFGRFMLDKYFENAMSIHLDESYPSQIKSIQSTKVTNHLVVGSDIDNIALDAFDMGYNIVSMRSFLDHAIYYLTYLKQAGLAGVPYEIEYGGGNDKYFINIHASVKNFVAEYLLESFGSVVPKKPLSFLLGVVASSCDFMEITYIENPGKVVLTGIWSIEEEAAFSGLMFNNIKTTAQTLVRLESKIKSYQNIEKEEQQLKDKQAKMFPNKLPDGLVELMMGKDPTSSLYKNPEATSKLVAIAVAKVQEYFPEKKLEDLGAEELNQVLKENADDDVVNKLTEKDLDFLLERVKNNKIEDSYYEEMERVRSKLNEDDDFKKTLGDTMSEEVTNRVAGHLDAETLNRILNGTPDEKEEITRIGGTGDKDEESSLVKGSKDRKESVTVVKGGKEEADNFFQAISSANKEKDSPFIQTISSAFEKEKSKFNVHISSGGAEDPKKGMFNFVSSVISSVDAIGDMSPSVKKFVKQKAPKVIEDKLYEFATMKGQKLESLSLELLDEFKDSYLPGVLQEVVSSEDLIEGFKADLLKKNPRVIDSNEFDQKNKFEENLKKNLQKKLEGLDSKYLKDGKFSFTNEDISAEDFQQVFKQSMNDTIKSEYALDKASKEEMLEKEKEIIDDLSFSFQKDKEEVVAIVKGASEKTKEKEVEAVLENLFSEKENNPNDEAEEKENNHSFEMNEMIRKLNIVEEEKKLLEKKVKALQIRNDSTAKTEEQVDKIKADVKQTVEQQISEEQKEQPVIESSMTPEEIAETIEKVKNKDITEEESQKLIQKIKSDHDLLAQANENENLLRKMRIETQHLEAQYKSELHKVNQLLRAKDTVIEQVKLKTQNLVHKKDLEIVDLKSNVNQLSSRLGDNTVVTLKHELSHAQKNMKNLERMNEIYKNKLEALSKSVGKNSDANITQKLTDQVKMLSSSVNQLENRLKVEIQKSATYQDRFTKTKESESKFRSQFTHADQKLKDYEMQIKKLREKQIQMANAAENQLAAPNLTAELEGLKEQNTTLNNKVKELTDEIKASRAREETNKVGNSGNEVAADAMSKNLQQGNKKLQQDLAKAQGSIAEQKKDFMKQKAENTALKNQIQALKKDLEKAKADAKKRGGAKKAA